MSTDHYYTPGTGERCEGLFAKHYSRMLKEHAIREKMLREDRATKKREQPPAARITPEKLTTDAPQIKTTEKADKCAEWMKANPNVWHRTAQILRGAGFPDHTWFRQYVWPVLRDLDGFECKQWYGKGDRTRWLYRYSAEESK